MQEEQRQREFHAAQRKSLLDEVVAACPESKLDDLVFLQEGMLEPIFQKHGLYGPTQAALWLSCVRKGGKPVDGITGSLITIETWTPH